MMHCVGGEYRIRDDPSEFVQSGAVSYGHSQHWSSCEFFYETRFSPRACKMDRLGCLDKQGIGMEFLCQPVSMIVDAVEKSGNVASTVDHHWNTRVEHRLRKRGDAVR